MDWGEKMSDTVYTVKEINQKIDDILFNYSKLLGMSDMSFEEYTLVKCILYELQLEFNKEESE